MAPLTYQDVAARIRAALAARPPRRVEVPEFQRAAVLVPLLDRPGGPTFLFTRRTEALRRHRGEISFPGGRLEQGEAPRQAALRETAEEIGLEAGAVEVLGELDERPTVSSYVVTPVVGLVARPPERFGHHRGEVHEVFEVPVPLLVAPGMPRGEWWDSRRLPPDLPPRRLDDLADVELDREHGRYRVWFYDVSPDRIIWGLTARVLKELLERALP
jgi:8-oxo-dGTP pyrophosphatase MutT (NUDIX family)